MGSSGIHRRRVWRPGCVLLLLLVGCAGGQPRQRLGCLPFPGPFTLFDLADPEGLGAHHYASPNFGDRPVEHARGIVYTCRAGFLDLAHLRDTIDWTRYASGLVEETLRAETQELTIQGRDWTTYHVSFRYPDFWAALGDDEREVLTRELSYRIGAELAYVVQTWHEIITWYGYKSTGIIPEHGSSFTYDDTMSHAVGLVVADRALRDTTRSFDDAVTFALDDELRRLGVVSREQAFAAVKQVEGEWWESGRCLERQVDVGLRTGAVRPWLVPDLPCCETQEPAGLPLPSLAFVGGYDFRGLYDVELETVIFELSKMRSVFPVPGPERFRPATDFPVFLDDIKTHKIARRNTE